MNLAYEGKGKKKTLGVCTRSRSKLQDCIVEVRESSSTREFASVLRRHRQSIDCGSRRFAAQEQETIQKSKDATIIMSANVTTHKTEEATLSVNDMDMFVDVQLLEDSPAVLSLENIARRTITSMSRDQGSLHSSPRMV